MDRSAVVIGGGIGGLATALALTRTGWQVTLLEQAREVRAAGAGITLAPNAVRALDWLGLGGELRATGALQGGAGLRTSSGRWLMRAHVEELKRRFGVPGFALHRAELMDMLTRALPDGVIGTDRRVTGVRAEEGAVSHQGAHGSGTVTADLVVAADGLRSTVRETLFPAHPGPAYAGYVTWRAVVPRDAAAGLRHGSMSESWGRGQRFGIVPLADGGIYWYATLALPTGTVPGLSLGELADRFRGWHEPVPQLLAATPPGTLLRHDIHSLTTPLPSYVAGRVVLLGDAAHAVTPDLAQGACQALEDAVTLARTLEHEPSLPAALAAYDRVRLPRTQRMVRVSAQAGRLAQAAHPVTAFLRDAVAWALPTPLYMRIISETMSWRPGVTAES
ncbi:FAD-dependent oxidoreductase [Nonomuraea sp. NPDC049725]|uniref:FAD-dependent oxidoreductase n=1 Tax=Nonomuraea sp. NPDC049725 TaxID=3154508 RepID=UPI00341EBD02